MTDRLIQLCVEDGGQDLIEYALLSGIVGIVGLLVFPQIAAKMSDAYQDWMFEIENAWEPSPPSG